METGVQTLAAAYPQRMHADMSLGDMGAGTASNWSDAEQKAFGAVLRRQVLKDLGSWLDVPWKEFHDALPNKTQAEVTNFHGGAWRKGTIPIAKEYFSWLALKKVGHAAASAFRFSDAFILLF